MSEIAHIFAQHETFCSGAGSSGGGSSAFFFLPFFPQGNVYAEVLTSEVTDTVVVAGCCRTESKGQAFAEKFSATWYDNYAIGAQSQAESAAHARLLQDRCRFVGAELNVPKSQLQSSQLVEYVGKEVDLRRRRHRLVAAWCADADEFLDAGGDTITFDDFYI